MNQNASGQVTDGASAAEGEAPEAAPTDGDASQVIAQCLRIAARRGRQIRLARAARLEL